MSIIDVKNLTLAYDGVTVIENLSFSVEVGDYIFVVGENGSGKSTLIKSILGLIPSVSGSIEFDFSGKNKGIGYLPQQTQIQRDFPASVGEVVHSGFASRPIWFDFKSLKKRKAHDIMHSLGIESLVNKCYRELSGGQQQKVLLARALCATENLLILDEPVTGLDPISAADMYSTVRKLNEEGLTVIMVSHDIKTAVQEAKKILHVSHDTVFFGSSSDYKASAIGSKFLKEAQK